MRNHQHNAQVTSLALLVLCICALASGCTSFHFKKPKSLWPLDVEKGPQQPASMAAIWSDTELYLPNQPPTRGFGGRLYFYDKRNDAIPVEGQLIVYVYDDDLGSDHNQPDRKYVFTPEQFAKHQAGSELGPSYSVWIPWDAVGGPTKQLSLVPFFQPTKGQVVSGELTKHRLPGAKQVPPGQNFSQSPSPASPVTQMEQHFRGNVPQANAAPMSDVAAVDYQRPIENANANDAAVAQPHISGATFPQGADAASIEPASMRTTTFNVAPITRDRLSAPPASRLERYRTVPRNSEEGGQRWDQYNNRNVSPAAYQGARTNGNYAAPANWNGSVSANPPADRGGAAGQQALVGSAPAYRSMPPSGPQREGLSQMATQPSAAGYSPSPRPDRFAQRPRQVPNSQSEQSSDDRSRSPLGLAAPPSDPRWPHPRYPESRAAAASPAAATGGF